MRKTQIAISSDLCIRLTWNLTGSCGQQHRLRGWSVYGKTIPRWRTAAILKIDISPYLSEKSSDFDGILYTAADFELDERHVIKNEKVALDRLRVRQNVILVGNLTLSLLFLYLRHFRLAGSITFLLVRSFDRRSDTNLVKTDEPTSLSIGTSGSRANG